MPVPLISQPAATSVWGACGGGLTPSDLASTTSTATASAPQTPGVLGVWAMPGVAVPPLAPFLLGFGEAYGGGDDDIQSVLSVPSLLDEESDMEESSSFASCGQSISSREDAQIMRQPQWCANMRRAKCSFHCEPQSGAPRGCRFWHIEEYCLLRLMQEHGGRATPAMLEDFRRAGLSVDMPAPALPCIMVKHHATLLQGLIHDLHVVEEAESAQLDNSSPPPLHDDLLGDVLPHGGAGGGALRKAKRKRRGGGSDRCKMYPELSALLATHGIHEADDPADGSGVAAAAKQGGGGGDGAYRSVKAQIRCAITTLQDVSPVQLQPALLRGLYEMDSFVKAKCTRLGVPLHTLKLAAADPAKKNKLAQKRNRFRGGQQGSKASMAGEAQR